MSSHPESHSEVAALSTRLVQGLRAAQAAGLPLAVRQAARLRIADALGIAFAAGSATQASQVVHAQNLLSNFGGRSTVIGGGVATPGAAAFINAALIHILDFDDIYDAGRLHPGAVVLPAALAAAEIDDAPDDLLVDAVALAGELICRLGLVCAPKGEGPGSDWFLTQLFGYVAAGIAAGLTLALTQDELVSCIGLAYMQAAGGKQAGFGTGCNARAVYPAFAAQGGLQAALLARAGITGPQGALDGAAGLFRIYLGGPLAPAQEHTLLDFSHWYSCDIDIKPWPSCRLSHPYVAMAVTARSAPAAGIIASASVAVNASAARLCRPLAQRRRPQTLQDAKYSIPFMTAFALVHGAPTLENLNEAVLDDEQVLDMAARIKILDIPQDNPGHPPAVLTVAYKNGATNTFRFSADDLRMDDKAVWLKFENCFRHAGRGGNAKPAWDAVIDGRIQTALGALAAASGSTLGQE